MYCKRPPPAGVKRIPGNHSKVAPMRSLPTAFSFQNRRSVGILRIPWAAPLLLGYRRPCLQRPSCHRRQAENVLQLATGEEDPLTDLDSRLLVGLPPR